MGNAENHMPHYNFMQIEMETRKYLYAIGVDCLNITDKTPNVLTRQKTIVQSLIGILDQNGYTRDEIIDLIYKVPEVLTLDSDKLEMRFEFFKSVGLKSQDFLTDEIRPLAFTNQFDSVRGNVEVMQELISASTKWIHSLMKYKPALFRSLVPSRVRANIIMLKELLMQHGCAEHEAEKILKQAVRDDYRLFKLSKPKMMAIVKFFTDKEILGADFAYVIKRSPNVFQSTPEQLEQRMKHLEMRLELNESQVKQFVVLYPRALGMKKENFDEHLDFFTDIGVTLPYVLSNPYILWIRVSEARRRYMERKRAGLFSTSPTPVEIIELLKCMNMSKKRFDKSMEHEIKRSTCKASKKGKRDTGRVCAIPKEE